MRGGDTWPKNGFAGYVNSPVSTFSDQGRGKFSTKFLIS